MELTPFLLTSGATAATTSQGLDENVLQLMFLSLVAIGVLLALAARGATATATPAQRSWSGGILFLVGLVLGGGLIGSNHFLVPGGASASGAAAAIPAGPGRNLFTAKPCPTCHTIDGLSAGTVGPALNHFGSKSDIAGVGPNNRENLIKWLKDPPAMKPGTAMPNNGLSDEDAAQLADFLLALK